MAINHLDMRLLLKRWCMTYFFPNFYCAYEFGAILQSILRGFTSGNKSNNKLMNYVSANDNKTIFEVILKVCLLKPSLDPFSLKKNMYLSAWAFR
jgi:hypothetical protein